MRGLSGEGALEAAMRSGLDHALRELGPDLARLEADLEEPLDAGSFLMGCQVAAIAFSEMDVRALTADPMVRRLMKEYIARARAAHP